MELKIHDQEILLQKLWKSRKLFAQQLRTTTGKSVEVIFAGTENLDSGPDFKDAVLKLDGKLLKGDVEVHLNSSGWYEHGHHKDPAYNGVILHLVSNDPQKDKTIERQDGVQVQQIYLDVELYKSSLWRKSQPTQQMTQTSSWVVAHCPLSKEHESKILATINVAAERRLEEKADRLQEELPFRSWDQLIYENILEALGYSKNQIPFRKLAQLIPFEVVCGEMQWVSEEMALKKCAALFFGGAGLLPSQIKKTQEVLDAETLEYIAPLEFLWDQISHRLEIKPMKAHEWQFFRLRPQNFPTRRLAGVVQIIHKFFRHGFLNGLMKIFYGNALQHERLINELEAALIVNAEGFWTNHYRFEAPEPKIAQNHNPALIGRDRARDIVVNIVLPILYLYSSESQDGKLKNLVHVLFVKYPKLSENSITRSMNYQLFTKENKNSKCIQSASQQQGLIYLHKIFCRPLKCSECLDLTQ